MADVDRAASEEVWRYYRDRFAAVARARPAGGMAALKLMQEARRRVESRFDEADC